MVIVYGLAALLGGLVSCVLLWPYGVAIALLSMPFGGSLFVLITAILVYLRASNEASSRDDRAVYVDQPPNLQTTESRR
jgi:heme A synthase